MTTKMSTALVLQIVSIVGHAAFGQNQWQWQNPLPQGNNLYDMCFLDSSFGCAVGHGGTVMRTTNGGAYWQYIHTRFNRLFLKTSFVSRERGWVMTYQPYVMLRTTDGGLIWDSLSVLPGTVYYDLAFANDTLGFASGGNGQIARTADGGATWSTSQVTSFGSILSIQCASADIAWGVTTPLTLRTTNGGQTWNDIWPPYPVNCGLGLQRITCRNAQEAAVVGSAYDVDSLWGYFAITTNGGTTWRYSKVFNRSLTDVYFCSRDSAWVADDGGTIYFTSNGGITWSQRQGRSTVFAFANDRSAWGLMMMNSSQIAATSDGWLSSFAQTHAATTDILWAVSSMDSNHAIAGGNTCRVLGTTNGGRTWDIYYNPNLTSSLKAIFCRPTAEVFCVGSNGTVVHSTDWGTSWSSTNLGSAWLSGITFLNQDTGFVTGTNFSNGVLYRTTDGGLSWNLFQTFSECQNLGKIVFARPDLGWIAAQQRIFRSTDAGTTWNSVYSSGSLFFDVSASGDFAWFSIANRAVYTTDAGLSWATSEICPVTPSAPNDARSLVFIDILHGWSATGNGGIFKTTNGGVTWSLDTHMNHNSLFSVCQSQSGYLWAVGSGGAILQYGGEPTSVGSGLQGQLADGFRLYQNYPNPFNPATKIGFDLPQRSYVRLTVYDLLGREVATLLDGVTAGGVHEATFNTAHLASGIYFYRLNIDNFSQTRKMVLQK